MYFLTKQNNMFCANNRGFVIFTKEAKPNKKKIEFCPSSIVDLNTQI